LAGLEPESPSCRPQVAVSLVVRPLLTYLEETDQREPERGLAVVILPEIVPARWWQNLLHKQTTLLIKAVLLFRQERGGAARVVIHVPYHLHG
jgi:hypothetical protein